MTKKIAFILFSIQAGGAERNAINFCKHSQNKQFDTDLIVIKSIHDYKEEYRDEDIKIVPLLSTQGKIPNLLIPITGIKILFQLIHIAKQKKYDLFIGGSEYLPFYAAILLSVIFRKKSLLLVGNNIAEENNHRNLISRMLSNVMFKLSFRFADSVIAVSKQLTQDLIENYDIPKGKIHTVYNGVDITYINKMQQDSLPEDYVRRTKNKKVVITMGRLVYKKGFEHLIRSFRYVKKKLPDSLLVIIGKGKLQQKLMDLARTLQLKDDIVFLGFIPDNPYKYIRHADVFAFSSLFEGFGNVIVEAMACKTPVVSADCPYGPREIIVKGTSNGLLTPPFTKNSSVKNEKKMAKSLLTVLENPMLFNPYPRANQFTAKRMTDQYLDIINKLIQNA